MVVAADAKRGSSVSALSPHSTSLALDLLRAIAAQAVCVGHALSFFRVWPTSLPYPQNIAVCVFFVLSGYLIGATLLRRSEDPRYGFASYAIDRFARIYSGWVPALVVVAIIDGCLVALDLHGTPEYVTPGTWVGNLFMLQGYRGLLNLGVVTFGSGGPFWTLAIEWHIYMLVGAVFFLLRRPQVILLPVVLFSLFLPLRYLWGASHPGLGTGLFGLWLLGFGFAALPIPSPPVWISALLLASGVACIALVATQGHEYQWSVYLGLIPAFAAYLMLALRLPAPGGFLAATIRFAAAFSLTLYLLHYTLMYAITRLAPGSEGWGLALASILLSNTVAVAVAWRTEMRHRDFGRWIKAVFATVACQDDAVKNDAKNLLRGRA
jgi:peptidoglycan/LPS O-acetylase OafA/YrhL